VAKKIIILPKEIREKIRAGEVVERPASVVKELIENSIDAESSRIVCEIEQGGAKKIKVVDNGTGMTPSETELSLERYATSKISVFDDIMRLQTFGFRGEALPSIRAVSELSIESKKQNSEMGFLIKTEGDGIVEKKPQAKMNGTTVEIKRLFFNVPVRRKFLKSETTEFRHIRRVFIALALVNRKIHFTLFNNGVLNLDFPPSKDLSERFSNLLGVKGVQTLLSFSRSNGAMRVQGVIARSEDAQSRRDMQYIFVNRRWVQNNLARKAVYQAYGKSLWGKHPIFLLEITLPGTEVDVNVHPTKREVKFRHTREIFESVFTAIKDTLTSKEQLPELSKEKNFAFKEERAQFLMREEPTLFSTDNDEKIQRRMERSMPKGFWQLHRSYIFASTKTGFMIVDQHAAHERIIFDRIMRRKEPLPPQMLLFPLNVDLTIQESEFLEANIEKFYEIGFRIKRFSGNTIVIEGVPPFVKEIEEDLVHEILQAMIEQKRGKEVFSEIAREIACKVAIKAGKELEQEEMNKLFDSLFATDDPYSCPHGRPTMIKFTADELEKRFRRK